MGKIVAERLADARARARATGRCITCRKAQMRPGMATCQKCSDEASARTRARRAARKGKP